MLPDMSAKVSFLTRRLAPEEMKPRLAAGRSALIDRNGKKFAYLRRETGSGRRRSGLGQRLATWWRFTTSPFTENPACWLETGERGVPVAVLPFSSTVVTGPKKMGHPV
jgi:hypothetical protein